MQSAKHLPANHADPDSWLLQHGSWFDPATRAACSRAEETLARLQEAKRAAEAQAGRILWHLDQAIVGLSDEQREGLLAAIRQHTFCSGLAAESAALLMDDAWADHVVEIVYGNPDSAPTDFSAAGLATWLRILAAQHFTATWPSDGEH